MTSPILKPFTAGDLERIWERDGKLVPKAAIVQQALQGPAFTAWLDGHPVGAAGVTIPWRGLGIVWMVASSAADQHGLWMTRTIKRMLVDIRRAFTLHRMEAIVDVLSARDQRWIQAIGFHAEQDGLAHKYLPTQHTVRRFEWVED